MADSLQQQIRRLEDLSRLQRRFTCDVSHELRTPLTTIRMAAELLHGGRDDFRPELAGRPSCCATSSTGSRRCSPTCWRSPATTPGWPTWRPRPVDIRARRRRRRSRPTACSPSGTAARWSSSSRTRRSSSRWTPAGSSASCATCSATPSTTARASRSRSPVGADDDAVAVTVRDHGVGLRPGRGRPGVQPVLARRPVAQPAHRRHRARAWRSASRTPGCTTAGCRPGASAAAARSSG